MKTENPTQIAVLGLGYVGCVTAACLASLGHRVFGVDRDEHKVREIRNGRAPFYEPGLAELVRENTAAGRLSASTSADAIGEADIVLVCVGTPSEKNGNLGLHQLRRAVGEIAAQLVGRDKTVDRRDPQHRFSRHLRGSGGAGLRPLACAVTVVSHPEFLREGSAVRDFFEPSLLVVGGARSCVHRMRRRSLQAARSEASLVSLRTAEMIKYASNAFHAVKISFANEIGALCEQWAWTAMK